MGDVWTTALYLVIGVALGMGLALYLRSRR
jgi:ABC-type phosphate transport system permease subunit